ncbi:MAG: hypothetical protein ACK5OS_07845 [Chryseotalea sp.]|jgi:hypothetical protein
MELSGKLTVKHFLYIDTRKPKKKESQDLNPKLTFTKFFARSDIHKLDRKYSIYIRISLDKKQFDIKSEFQEFLPSKKLFDLKTLSEINHFREEEFYQIMSSNSNEISLAIEAEKKVVWDVANFLRNYKFNIARKGAKVILREFLTPIEDAIKKSSMFFLKNAIIASTDLKRGKDLISIINWNQEFDLILNSLLYISKEPISTLIYEKFRYVTDLLKLLPNFTESFIKKKINNQPDVKNEIILLDNKILVYQWRYYGIKSTFEDFLIQNYFNKDDINEYLYIIDFAINSVIKKPELEDIKLVMFPYSEKYPKNSLF